MNGMEMEHLLRKKATAETSCLTTSREIDEKIHNSARLSRKPSAGLNRKSLMQRMNILIPLFSAACICTALLLIPIRPSSPSMEKDCLQFYAQLTKAINDRDVEKITSSYGKGNREMNPAEMRTRLERLFRNYESINYKPGTVSIKSEGKNAVLLSRFELTAVSRNGQGPVNMTGTDRIYFQKSGNEIKVALWVSE